MSWNLPLCGLALDENLSVAFENPEDYFFLPPGELCSKIFLD